jgi:hypothetical protein
MFGYGYQWLRPFDYAVADRSLWERTDDIGKQMLGMATAPDGSFVPGGVSAPLRQWCKSNGVKYRPLP